MPITYADVAPFADSGTDPEITAAMRASHLTVRDVPVPELQAAMVRLGSHCAAFYSRQAHCEVTTWP